MKVPQALGPYEVGPVIHSGRTGAVYAGHGPGFAKVALKIIDPLAATQGHRGDRFLRGAETARRADSAHLARILEVGTAATGHLWCAMSFIEGSTLSALLSGKAGPATVMAGPQATPIPLDLAIDLGRQIASGLQTLHDLGVVHRNVKPSNVMVTIRPGGARVAIVVGMGLLKLLDVEEDEELTETGAVVGAPAYLAPEALTDSSRIDARADIYSLGVLLYEIILGRLPFNERTVMDQLIAKMDGLQKVEIPDAKVASLVARMLAPDREQRPASMREVVAALGTR